MPVIRIAFSASKYVPIEKNDMIVMLVYDNDICFKITDGSHAVSVYTATGAGPFMVDFIGINSGSYSTTLKVRAW